MARGDRGTTPQAEDILFGLHQRSPDFRVSVADDGCQEYYDIEDRLCRVGIPEDTERSFPSPRLPVRVSGPALVHVRDGRIHRYHGPAIEAEEGRRYWYQDGRLHREDGPAAIDPPQSMEVWWYEGKRHREDGPAVITTGANGEIELQEYWQDDFRHREGGPAVISILGEEYYIRGTHFGADEYPDALKDFLTLRYCRSGARPAVGQG